MSQPIHHRPVTTLSPKTSANWFSSHLHGALAQAMPAITAALMALCMYVSLPVGQSEARPPTRQVHATWEELMGNQIFLAYYSVGLVGDLYRAKVYTPGKTKRVTRLLTSLLKKEKAFLKKIRVGRGRKQRALYRHLKATVDILLLALESLDNTITNKEGSKIQQFLQYRNAAAQDLQKLLYHRGLRRRRRYRGGYYRAMKYLNHHLGLDLAYGYLCLGLVADGYFQLVINPKQTEDYLSTQLRLLTSGRKSLGYIQRRLRGSDRSTLQTVRGGMLALYNVGMTLGQVVKTRKRSLMRRYQQLRRLAWQTIKPMAAP
ncbi:MAG: hypothetical protein EP343_31085 [Deltaproteobacteria bacterium]|nr:MAG: hypothetical protein EP343_31085 [Deltaproteobacteria bacterium]